MSPAETIAKQIETGVKMSLGYRPAFNTDNTLSFKAKPRHRIRYIDITLNPQDLYDITLRCSKTGQTRIKINNIQAEQLNHVLLDLETNPKA